MSSVPPTALTSPSASPADPASGVRRIIAMELVSGLGDGIFWVGFVAALLDRGLGPGAFAVAALVRLGPRALLGAPAGALADRVDLRRLLMAIDVGRAVCMVTLALSDHAGAHEAVLFTIVVVSYVLAAPYRPALTAGLPLVSGESLLAAANARVGTVRQVMTFIGPLVGAAVVQWGSPSIAFWTNAATFLVAAMLLGVVPALSTRRGARATTGRGPDRAWSAVLGAPGLMVVTALVFVLYAVRGAELVLYALAAEQTLGLGTAGIGVLTGAVGLGALIAMPFAARLADIQRIDVAFVLTLGATALPLLALGWTESPVLACLVLLVVGATVVVFEVLCVVVFLRLVDDGVLGRVFGLVGSASNGGKLAGALLAPAAVAWVDVSGAFVAFGAVVLVASVAALPSLRRSSLAGARRRAELLPLVDTLSSLALFHGASRPSLQRIASVMVEQRVPAGTVVLRQGDPPDDLYLVRVGSFDAVISGTVVNTIDVDGWFGEIGLLRQVPRTATVVARVDGVVWRVPGPAFLAALGDVASLPMALLSEMSERLRRTAALGG